MGSDTAIEVDDAMTSEEHRTSESAASTNADPDQIPTPVQQQEVTYYFYIRELGLISSYGKTDGANKPASIEEQAGTACLPENVDSPHALPEV